jgi:WD40 repeat protein
LLSIPHAYGTSADVVGLSPDGLRILVVKSNDTSGIWDAESGALLKTISLGHVWHSETADKIGCTQASASDCVTTVSIANFSPDGKRFVTAAFYDNAVKLWDAETGSLLREFKHAPQSEVSNAVFNPDGKLLLTSSGDMTAKLWDTSSGTLLKTFRGHKGYVDSARFSADAKKVLTASRDGTVMIWDVVTGGRLATLQVTSKTWVSDARFSPDGSQIVATSPSGHASVWNIKSRKLLLTLGDFRVNDASFSPDGKQVLTLSDAHEAPDGNGVAQLWDSQTGSLIRELRIKGGFARGYELGCCNSLGRFVHSGTLIILAPLGPEVLLWDGKTGNVIMTFASPTANGMGAVLYGADVNQRETRILAGYATGDRIDATLWAVLL